MGNAVALAGAAIIAGGAGRAALNAFRFPSPPSSQHDPMTSPAFAEEVNLQQQEPEESFSDNANEILPDPEPDLTPDQAPEAADHWTPPDPTPDEVAEALDDWTPPSPKPKLQYIHGAIKIMSYNVCSIKYIEIEERMKAINHLIQQHSPDILLLQEITPFIYKFFQNCEWWELYKCSVRPAKASTKEPFCMLLSKLPVMKFFCKQFDKASTGSGLCVAKTVTKENKKLVIATCHLKRPARSEEHSIEQVSRAKMALDDLCTYSNVVLGGDMIWDESSDGPFPLPGRWCDAWCVLRPGENGWTYDTISNAMLRHSRWLQLSHGRALQKRLDRFICKLKDFEMIGIEMIGTETIPGVHYKSNGKIFPVLPSDHYGLILTICPK